ncbi:MAG: antiterminator LoaP [Firmicutes bacterium]|nr:antiterminator LoaP [Bacillota bacterium]
MAKATQIAARIRARNIMWYVIWTYTGQEEKTRGYIERFVDPSLYSRCAIPYMAKIEKHGGIRVKVEKLLFPSYVFVLTDHIDEFADALHRIPGFTVVLHTGDFFQPLAPHEEYILSRLIGSTDVVDISTGFLTGDTVSITYGPLKGLEGQIKKIDRHRRIAILQMTMFDRTTDVKVGLEIVEKKE